MPYRLYKSCLYLLAFLSIQTVYAQSFHIKPFKDFFKSSITLHTELMPGSVFKEAESVNYGFSGYGLQMNVPLKGKVELDLNLSKLKNFKDWKSIRDIKKLPQAIPLDVRGYQLFWTFNGGYRDVSIDFEAPNHRLFYAQTGIMGFHLQPKMRMLFYSFSIGGAEDENTIRDFKPRFEGFIGQARVHKFAFIYYYGVYANYGDRRPLILPFVGMNFTLPPVLNVQVILPLQMKITYRKKGKPFKASVGVELSGFRSGFENRQQGWLPESVSGSTEPLSDRLHLSSTYLLATTDLEYKTGNKGRVVTRFGAVVARDVSFWDMGEKVEDFTPNKDFYIGAMYQLNLGKKSLIKNIWERLEFDF